MITCAMWVKQSQYPNLAAEIWRGYLGDICMSNAGNVTPRLLQAFAQGRAEITIDEFSGMWQVAGVSLNYLAHQKLVCLNRWNKKHRHRVAAMIADCKKRLQTCVESRFTQDARKRIKELEWGYLGRKQVMQAELNGLRRMVEHAEQHTAFKTKVRPAPRDIEPAKKITAPGGNPETVTSENDSTHISPIV